MIRLLPSIFLTFTFLSFSAAANFENPVNVKTAVILPAGMLRSNDYQIASDVSSDGYSFTFMIDSKYGSFQAEGRTHLGIRLQEIAAISELKKVTGSEAFAKAAGAAVMKPIESTANLVQNPTETVKGIPGGVKRKFENLGRWGKRTAQKASEEEEIDPPDEGTPETKSTDSTTATVSKSLLGVTAAHRRWAEKVGADPYSTNPVLQEELNRLAKYDAVGKLGTNLVRPKIPEIETATRINNLVWSKDPEELRKLNETSLAEMAIDKDVSVKFLNHKSFTLTYQTQIISSLNSLGRINGQSDFLRAALSARSEEDALFYCDSAAILGKMQQSGNQISGFVSHPRIALVRSGKKLIAVLPADRLFWTAGFDSALQQFLKTYQAELEKASAKELWLSGDATRQTRAEMKSRGWIIRENMRNL